MTTTIAEIEAHPEALDDLSPDDAIELATRLAALQMRLVLRAQNGRTQTSRLLSMREAEERLNVSHHWMVRHAATIPEAKKVGKFWRFTEAGIAKYLRQRTAR